MVRPSGTVTFLFTDIEGSTRRWEADPDEMRSALAVHDEVLRNAVEGRGGWLFKHTGDGVCAAFSAAGDAVAAAVDAQLRLGLPVRMGVATGEAELRGDDYFGPALNRAARVMAAGHGGQVLVANSTAALVSGVGLVDLGERRLRDLSGAEHLFQVRAEGLGVEFPPLRTLDAVPGNLAVQSSSFLGRQAEVKELCELVRGHRMVTLTGVGGVGKTRLAVQVAGELAAEFPDGVWLVELAAVGDPAAVADAVATALGVTPQAGLTVTGSVAEALSGRRLLVVLDNCEHVLDAAALVVETILGRAATVQVIATSREGLRVGAEQLWPVPSLDVDAGISSAAVELFVERSRAANPGFSVDSDAELSAVVEICARLDGIALAIELAAARMVSMTAQDVRDRLGDRFRLLAGARRGLERHQTLRHAVGWSYDLLDPDEQRLLNRCSVFADGFDLAAAAVVCGSDDVDEYTVLDLLDSLVRKSLLAVSRGGGHARFAMLETIRQYAEDQLAVTGTIGDIRDRHARYYAKRAVRMWDVWNSPEQLAALDWVDAEFANLRSGFRWATERAELDTAAAIASHAALLAFVLQRFEPVGWAEELLDAATTADIAQLPRLYTASSFCNYIGRPDAAISYAHTAATLEAEGRHDPFERGYSEIMEAFGYRLTGRLDRWLEICAELAEGEALARVLGLSGLVLVLPAVGRGDEARSIAASAVAAGEELGYPFWSTFALLGYGRAFAGTDPERALDAFRRAMDQARQHRLLFFQARIGQELAGVEAIHGDLPTAMALFGTTLEAFHRAGNVAHVAEALAELVVVYDHIGRPDVAAILYGASQRHAQTPIVVGLPAAIQHLRDTLSTQDYDTHVAAGHSMSLSEAVRYAREQLGHDPR